LSDEPAEKSPEPSTETAHEMPREAPTPQRRRILLKLFLGFCAFTLIAFGLLSWYVTTESFQRIVRRRVIAAAEQLTGGRVELGELHTIPLRLRVEVRNLTIHGHEAADQAPFLHVDRVQAEMKIISLLSTTVGLHSVVLEHPVVHLIDYPDGSTNAPVPPARLESNQQPVEQLLSLSVSHIEVQRGELLWENKNVPFDFDARDLALVLHYSLLRRQYEAQVRAGAVDTHFQNYASFVWRADASLVLARNRVDIKSLTIASGKSEFHFAGHLQDFHNPQLSGDYRGTADLGELASLGRQAQLRKGAAQFEGKVSWSLQTFSTDGSMQATDLEWSNGKISMRNGRIAAGFSLTPDRLRISSIRANLLGGDLRGDAEVINWQRSIPSFSRDPQEPALPPARRRRVATSAQALPQRGSIHLQLAGFPLFPAMQLLSSRKLPLDQLNLGGSTSGTVEMWWKGSIDDAESHVKLGVVPPAKTGPGEIPVLGQIDAVYRGSRGELEVSELHLTTPGSEITAAGTLSAKSSLLSMASSTASSSSSSLLRFSFTSHNLKEWTPLLEAAYARNDRTSGSRAHGLPFLIHGWAKLAGTASGPLSALSVNGNLEVYDFDVTLPATQQAASREVHWDALTAAVQFSTSHFAARNTSVIHGQTTAHFEVSADLEAGSFAENSAFTLHVDAHKADLAELLQWAGVTRPAPGTLTGTLDVAATLSGTRANPHGDGHIVLHQGVAYGVTIPLLTGDLRLANGELQFNNIDASAFDAPLSGDAAIGITGNDFSKSEFRLNVTGRNLDLARFPRLRNGHLRADGVSDFAVRMSGTPQQPSLEAHVHLKDLALDNERFGDFYVDAVTQGQQLQLTAHSGFERGDLNIAGSVSLDHDFPADLKLSFHQLDIDSLLREYLPVTLNGHSQLEGTLRLYGPLRTPRDLKATAELQSFAVKIDNVEVKSEGPIRLEVSDQMLRIEELHLAGSGTDFTAHGRAHLAGAQELDLRLDGSINMALFQSLNPKILARGTLGLKLDAGGTLSRPVLQGQLEVKNTFISHNDFPSGLSDLNGVLHFDRNRIQIESLSGTTGGGNVALTGSATYQDGAFALDFGATAQGVRLRYPPGVSSTANADLRLTGTSNNPSLSGDIVVTKLAVTPGFDFGAYIEKSRQATVISQSDSLESRLKLDVHVVTTPELQMQTAIARLSGNADLRVRGTAERPAILGRVEVLEGEINFNGNKYNLERGDVTFANPAKTQPVIDLQASTRVRDYDITVQFRGDASVPNGLKVTWQSEPQLPQADVIALLALGRTQEESAVAAASGSSFGFGGDASNLLINQALNSTVNSRLQRLFGASRVKVDPQGLASETSVVRGPQVTVEQQVASNVTLTYSTNVSVSNQQIIQLEYNITRTISIVALRDQNGVVSFDFKLRRRRK
jgi:translocation and assembly module TamB